MNNDQVASGFSKLIAAAAIIFALLALCSRAHAQGAPTPVAIVSNLSQVFNGVHANTCSPIVKDISQGSNILFVTQTGVGGGTAIFDLEWSPTGVAPFYPIVQALYSDLGTASHVLTTNGYWPNLRSCITGYAAGTYSAWYTSSSGPLSYAAPGVGTLGPSSPPICDQWSNAQVPTATTGWIGPEPEVASTDTVVICGMTISFNGATAAGAVDFQWAVASDCSSPTQADLSYTTANTPQTFNISTGFRSFSGVGGVRNFLCLANTSGATASVLINWMSLHAI